MKPLFVPVAFALALCTLQANCLATTSGDELPMRAVHYADLNLSRPADAALLYHRIQTAAELVCDAGRSRELGHLMRSRKCMASAVERAVATVHAPLLTQHYVALASRQILPPQAMRLNP
jgi:UrcA family protein